MLSVLRSVLNAYVELKMLIKKLRLFKQQLVLGYLLLLSSIMQPLFAAAEPGVANTGALAMQVFLGLLVVLALMFALAWLAKRLRLAPGAIGSPGTIQTLAVLPLGSRERLLLVQVGDEQLLLGVTSQKITCLHEMKTPIAPSAANTKPAFTQFMQHWSTKNQLKATKTEKEKTNETD